MQDSTVGGTVKRSNQLVLTAAIASVATAGCALALDTSGLSGGGSSSQDATAEAGVASEAGPDSKGADDAGLNGDVIPVIARDSFSRTVSDELGAAEIGGEWRTEGASAAFSVSDGAARIVLDQGSTRRAELTGVATNDADVSIVIATDKVSTGTAYLGVLGRAIGSAEYRCRLIIDAGAARATITRADSDDALTHLTESAPLFQVIADEPMAVRCQAAGSAPTMLRMKLWRAALGEPTAWTLTASDTTAALQGAGTVGVHFYMGVSDGAVRVSLDNLLVRPASRMP